LEVAVDDDTELSIEAKELVSDRVGDPPTLGLCGGGLGGGALGLDGRVVAIEAGLLTDDDFLTEATSDLLDEAVLEGLCLRGMMGGGCGALFFLGDICFADVTTFEVDVVDVEGSEAMDVTEADDVEMGGKDIAGIVSVGVASAARHTGKKLPFISTLVCKSGPEMSSLLIGLRSGLGGGPVGRGSLLLRSEEVGEERPLFWSSATTAFEAFSLFFSECDRLTSLDFRDFERLFVFCKLPLRPLSITLSDSGEAIGAPLSFFVGLPASEDPESVSSIWHNTALDDTALGSVDHVGVITEDTTTALASTGFATGTVVVTEVTGDRTDLGGGVGLGGVVTV